jgi:hypothetical protein
MQRLLEGLRRPWEYFSRPLVPASAVRMLTEVVKVTVGRGRGSVSPGCERVRIRQVLESSVMDPDPVGSETFSRIRIRIRKKSFRIRAAPEIEMI